MPDLDVQRESETGAVYYTSDVAVCVHDSVDNPAEAAQRAATISGDIPDRTARFDPPDDVPRSHTT